MSIELELEPVVGHEVPAARPIGGPPQPGEVGAPGRDDADRERRDRQRRVVRRVARRRRHELEQQLTGDPRDAPHDDRGPDVDAASPARVRRCGVRGQAPLRHYRRRLSRRPDAHEPTWSEPTRSDASHGDELGLLAERAATVAEQPTLGHREPAGVTRAQVVGVGIALAAEVVEPHLGLAVLVGQRDRRPLRAACP